MKKPIIEVKNLSKKYTLGERQPYYSFRDTISGIFHTPFRRHKLEQDEFWALKDVSFDINEGDVVGVIGRNGAGKSTLLKILSQITPPTEGEVKLRGRVASLLEVGTGFHPELTGKENIYLNGAILGMKRWEINNKFKEIVDFAEIEKFLNTPVKHYSSGMYMRLAFAVAAHLEPEILLVDEVLAVGDAQFQKKCLGKMSEVSKQGRTVIFVSHNIPSINYLCNKAIVLKDGVISDSGNTRDCTKRYTSYFENRRGLFKDHIRLEDKTIEIIKARVNGTTGDVINVSMPDNIIKIEINFTVKTKCKLSLEALLKDDQTNILAIYSPGHIDSKDNVFFVEPGDHQLKAKIELPMLNKGTYFLEPRLTNPGIQGYVTFPNAVELQVDGYKLESGNVFEQSMSGAGFQILNGSVKVE